MTARETVLERVGERVPGTPRRPRGYGPHRAEDAPTSVTVGRGAAERVVDVPAELLEQRARVNAIAHAAGYPEGVPCPP